MADPTLDSTGTEVARARLWIEVRCLKCHRVGRIPPDGYGRIVGDRPMTQAHALMRCLTCRTRGEAAVSLVFYGRG